MASHTSNSAYRVQVLDRTFSILTVLASSRLPLGPTDIGDRLNLNKSTVHRLLAVLERNRFVEREYDSGRYRLGLKLVELGGIALSRIDLHSVAKPFIERLAAETGETAHLGILRQTEIISLVNAEGTHTVRTPSTVGRRSPVHCTSQGKVLLAFQQGSVLDSLLRSYSFNSYTKKTIRSNSRFRLELARVRRDGFAVDEEEFEQGLRCIGAPVRDHTGAVVAAISIAGPSFRITGERTPELSRKVVSIADEISQTLGYRSSTDAGISAVFA
jgi:IclR family transcriptional regulator, KDG regulon repressor